MKLNALTATVLRVSQSRPAMEDKPKSDLPNSRQEQGHGQGQEHSTSDIPNRSNKPEHQNPDPAPQAKPDSTKPNENIADTEDKPSQATTDSQTTQVSQPAQEAQPSSVSEAIQNGAVENSSKENIPATPAKQAELPNTGTKNDHKLLFAGISLLALLGLGFLLKNKKEN